MEKTDFTQGLTRGQKVAYHLLYALVRLLSLLPFPLLYGLSAVVYFLLYKIIRYRVRVTRANLAASFPEKTADELRTIERRFYHAFCDNIVETIKQVSMSEADIRRRVRFHSVEQINQLTAQGKSVILYLGHTGNWEWITSIGLHLTGDILRGQIYHILENPAFNALMLRIRSRWGTQSISMNVTLRTIVAHRRKGIPMVIGFISDQVPIYQATYHSLTFLNHPGTLVITGTERIAKQSRFHCFYLDTRQERRGYYDIDIVPMGEATPDIPDWQLTDQYFRLLEQNILRQPELWMWTHNRWKRTHESWERWKKEKESSDVSC